MYKLTSENVEFYYFPKSESLSQQTKLPIEANIPNDLILLLVKESNDTRWSLFKSILYPQHGHFYILYWNNNQNLNELDRAVKEGVYVDDSFKSSVKTVYQNTVCDTCRRTWKTLVIPPGDPYPGSPGLLEHKIATSQFKICPFCGASLRQMVVKIFGELEE